MLQNFQKSDQTLASIFTNNIPNQPEMPVAQHDPYSSHNEKKSSLAEVKVLLNVATLLAWTMNTTHINTLLLFIN